jgi:hypothetical protein
VRQRVDNVYFKTRGNYTQISPRRHGVAEPQPKISRRFSQIDADQNHWAANKRECTRIQRPGTKKKRGKFARKRKNLEVSTILRRRGGCTEKGGGIGKSSNPKREHRGSGGKAERLALAPSRSLPQDDGNRKLSQRDKASVEASCFGNSLSLVTRGQIGLTNIFVLAYSRVLGFPCKLLISLTKYFLLPTW